MDKLEKYYNSEFSNDDKMPLFSVFSDEEKARLKNSLGFAFWNLSKAFSEFAAAIKHEFTKRRR